MKRKGYDENFDKENMMTKEELYVKRKMQEANESLADRKSKFMMNLVEFCVGAGLLVFCFSYLQSHPAEKSSLFSGAEAIYEKIRATVYRWTGGKSEELLAKFKLEKQYQEIIDIAILGSCLDGEEIQKLERALEKLEDLPVSDFIKQERAYNTVFDLYHKKVQSSCNLRNP